MTARRRQWGRESNARCRARVRHAAELADQLELLRVGKAQRAAIRLLLDGLRRPNPLVYDMREAEKMLAAWGGGA